MTKLKWLQICSNQIILKTVIVNMKLLTFLCFFLSFTTFSQLKPTKYKHNFGDLYANAPTYTDFTFTNNSNANIFMLTIDRPQGVNYIFSRKRIAPDSTFILRLKVNDKIKGKFNYKIDVYFSDNNQPVTLTLTGNIKEKNSNPLTDCPDFNQNPPNHNTPGFEVTIKVIDSLTREPIKKSKVYLVENGRLIATYQTNADGIVHKKIPLGYYFITAEKTNYNSNSKEGYINYQSNYYLIELQQHNQVRPDTDIDTSDIIVDVPNQPVLIVNEPKHPKPDSNITDYEQNPTPLNELPPSNFDSNNFKPNHIVFIVDISASMKKKGKMDLLKLSMIELTKILRPEDKVTLIAYSSDVYLLLEDVSGRDKDQIAQQINSLVSKGSTDGGKAIKKGFKLANKHKIVEGNNLIFMVTDGAFNKGQTKYKKVIRFNKMFRKIQFSVVGIKTGNYLTEEMTKMSKIGGGKYVKIMSDADAQIKLFEEIKRTSFRGY